MLSAQRSRETLPIDQNGQERRNLFTHDSTTCIHPIRSAYLENPTSSRERTRASERDRLCNWWQIQAHVMTLLRPRCLKNELIGNENSWTSALLKSTGFPLSPGSQTVPGLSEQHQQRRCGKPGARRVWAGLPEASPSECCSEGPQGSLSSGLSSHPGPGRPEEGSQALQAFGSDPSPSLRNPVPRDRAPGHGSWSQVSKARWGLLSFSSSPNTEKVSGARTLRTWDYSLHVTGRRRDAWEGSCFAPDHFTAGWWGYRWEET